MGLYRKTLKIFELRLPSESSGVAENGLYFFRNGILKICFLDDPSFRPRIQLCGVDIYFLIVSGFRQYGRRHLLCCPFPRHVDFGNDMPRAPNTIELADDLVAWLY